MDLSLLTLTFLDLLVALAIICAAFATDWYIERGPRADESTRAIMQKRRKEWMQVLAQRSLRMYDANLLSGLQSSNHPASAVFAGCVPDLCVPEICLVNAAIRILRGFDGSHS